MVKSILSTKVVIFNEKDEVLVLRRSETHPRKPHHTDLPGGLIEPGEYELLSAAREVKEETGITVDANNCILYFADTHILPSGNSLTMLVYYARFDHTPSVTISWEHESYEWCSIQSLLDREDLDQPERKSIEHALKYELFSGTASSSAQPSHG